MYVEDVLSYFLLFSITVPEIIDPVFAKTGSINSGTDEI
jgi:hypothetical protein